MEEVVISAKCPLTGDPEKRFEYICSYGQGGFGCVELCKDRENGNRLVIKKIAKIEKQSQNEIAMLNHINHKHIIKFYEYYSIKINQNILDRNPGMKMSIGTPAYCIIIEFGEGGDFKKIIEKRKSIEEIILLKILSQSTQALQYLNDNSSMHRDIKPENILLDKFGNVKLADFGTGDKIDDNATHRQFTQQIGTEMYMAPELILGHQYGFDIDIFSLGLSIYQACDNTVSNEELRTVNKKGEPPRPIPDQYSEQFKNIIEKMLLINGRATLSQIKETITKIITPKKLTDSDKELLDNSLNLFYGIDGLFDKKQAISNFQKLLEVSNYEYDEPAFQLSRCYLYGDSIEQNTEKAIQLLRIAARKQHANALKLLAFCYQYGIGVEKDLFTSVQLWTIAQKKDPETSFLLGYHIYNGQVIDITNKKWDSKSVIKQNYELAFHYFMDAKNFVPAQNFLGLCYLNGNGVEADPLEAYKYFSLAACGGSIDGKYNLAEFYLTNYLDNTKYTQKAIGLLTEAARQYHMGAVYKLQEIYNKGQATSKDEKKAAIYSKVNSTGPNMLDSLYSYALLKFTGLKAIDDYNEIQKNPYEAFVRFSIYSKHHNGAVYHLAECYRDGIGTEKNYSKAFELFEQASNNGILKAKSDLALCYLYGNGCPKDTEKAIKLLNESVDQYSLYAMCCLARCYLSGNGVEEDRDHAIKLLRSAHDKGYTEGTYLLANCIYKIGLETYDMKVLEEARDLYEIAADKGHKDAAYEYAMIFNRKGEIYIDKLKAFPYFKLASEKNHPQATTELGKLYETGYGAKQNKQKAFQLYRKASYLGDVHGTYHFGLCYIKGIGVEIDEILGRSILEKASEKDEPNAKYELAIMYQKGIGGTKDPIHAFELFQDSSNLGHQGAKVQLGKCYLHGIGVNCDPKKAIKIFRELDSIKNIEGVYRMAKIYKKGGCNVRVNPSESFLRFSMLANEKNFVPAITELACCYLDGFGCKHDARKGVQLLKKAAENGNAKAMVLLGTCYLRGVGVKKADPTQAAEYFKKANELGNKFGKVNLAQCYIEGKGVTQNFNKGYKLLEDVQEDPSAKFRIGICLLKGAGVNQDKKKGIELISDAAQKKDTNAMCYYAKMLIKGKEVQRDLQNAIILLDEAARNKHPEAMYQLACILEKSNDSMNIIRAQSLLEQSSENGSAKASYYLGMKYFNTEDKKVEGIKLIEKAANSNHIEALKEICRIYNEGDGIGYNEDKAEDYKNTYEQLCGKPLLNDMTASTFAPTKKNKAIEVIKNAKNKVFRTLSPKSKY